MPLLINYTFAFTSTYPLAFNTIINTTIPFIIVIKNPTSSNLIIPKSIRLSIIYKLYNNIYIIIDIKAAIKVLTFTSIIG